MLAIRRNTGYNNLKSDNKKCQRIFYESLKRLMDATLQVDLPFDRDEAIKRLVD